MSEFCNNPESPHQSAEDVPVISQAEAEKMINSNKPLSFAEYGKLQIFFTRTPFNEWCAGVALKHSPSTKELEEHFVMNGGAEWFAKTFRPRYEAYLAQKNATNKE